MYLLNISILYGLKDLVLYITDYLYLTKIKPYAFSITLQHYMFFRVCNTPLNYTFFLGFCLLKFPYKTKLGLYFATTL